MQIALINQSTLVKNSEAQLMAKACQIQHTLHFAPAWGILPATIKFYSDPTKIPGYAYRAAIIDNDTQVQGAAGYHSEDADHPDLFVMAEVIIKQGNGVVLFDPSNPQNMTVSSVLSHEVCELAGDRFANFWADDGKGNLWALETADGVQDQSYVINVPNSFAASILHQVMKTTIASTPVSMSNFVFPSYFNSQADNTNKPFDYLKQLTAPFTISKGGYSILMKEGKVSQKFGKQISPWVKKMKTSELSRYAKRQSQ